MKSSSFFNFFIFYFSCSLYVNAQVVEAEKELKKISFDTTKSWTNSGSIAINLSQTTLNNWTAGGQNTVSGNGIFNYRKFYKSEKASWDNNLDIGYGLLQQGESQKTLKTNDRLEFMSKYGLKASKNWQYAALGNFKTQFAPGYNYPNDSITISDFMAPGYVLTAIGMDYQKNENFSLFLSPLTSKITIVNSTELANQGAFGVTKAEKDSSGRISKAGKKMRSEVGGYVRVMFAKNIMKNVHLLSKLDLFSNYLDRPQNIDVSWETLITMKVNKYISATLNFHLLYDNDVNIVLETAKDGSPLRVGPRLQYKQIIGVGFLYKLGK